MRFIVASDLHLGFSAKGREEDCWKAAKELFNSTKKHSVDFLLLAGDIFDSAVPKQEVWHKAFSLFSILNRAKKSEVEIFRNNEKIDFRGIPIISIHGTHEYRAKDYKNALEVLQEAGVLIYLQNEPIIIQKENEKIALFGLGGIPEQYAKKTFLAWSPKPIEDAYNVLLSHQSLKDFMHEKADATLSLEDMPDGFQLYVNGHLHWSYKAKLHTGTFIMPGSPIITQLHEREATREKGYFIVDTSLRREEFFALKFKRPFYYLTLKFNFADKKTIENKIEESLQKIPKADLNPIVKIKLEGTLCKGIESSDISFAHIIEKYENMIISISKEFEDAKIKYKIEELRKLQKEKTGILDKGLELLEEELKKTNYREEINPRRLFELLAHDDVDRALELVISRIENNSKD